jgi:hypothetical protein
MRVLKRSWLGLVLLSLATQLAAFEEADFYAMLGCDQPRHAFTIRGLGHDDLYVYDSQVGLYARKPVNGGTEESLLLFSDNGAAIHYFWKNSLQKAGARPQWVRPALASDERGTADPLRDLLRAYLTGAYDFTGRAGDNCSQAGWTQHGPLGAACDKRVSLTACNGRGRLKAYSCESTLEGEMDFAPVTFDPSYLAKPNSLAVIR